LAGIIQSFGPLTYILLFLIIFCETGLVITPFLPGDSLLFTAGALSATGSMDIILLLIIFTLAAILGDSINYWMGSIVGPKIFKEKKSKLFNQKHLLHAKVYYEKHGVKTIVLARFIPIIRTFAPFVAGIGKMPYHTFLTYNIVGGILWVTIFLFAGYFFGNIPIVKENLWIIIFAIIVITLLPAGIEYINYKKESKDKP
jgi:membrane-associated protein